MIQLAAPIIQSGYPNQPNVNDAQAAVVNIHPSAANPATQIVLTVRYGNGTVVAGKTGSFITDVAVREVEVALDAAGGTWSSGGQGGALTPAQVNAMQALLNSITSAANKNQAESFIVGINLLGPGCTTVPW